MRRWACAALPLMLMTVTVQALNWQNAQWIWHAADGPDNTWMCFRKTFTLESVPANAMAHIAVESRYWLWINGTLVIREGGLKRGPNRTDSWYDDVDVTPYLQAGTNTIAVQVNYWGTRANHYYKSYHPSGKGGLVFLGEFGATTVRSDATWKLKVPPAYGTATIQPNDFKPEWSVRFDAAADLPGWQSNGYNDSAWTLPTTKGTPPIAPWGGLHRRTIPQWWNSGLQNYTNAAALGLPKVATGTDLIAQLPYNALVYPYLRVNAAAGKVITLRAYDGKELNLVAEYVTKAGDQSFEMPNWINGHAVRYTIPAGVTITELKYRETRYAADLTGSFTCNDAYFNQLWTMATRTLVVCERDTFMDCPDRERALWWGDAVLQMSAAFYTQDRAVDLLTVKCANDLIGWRKADGALSSPIPYSVKNYELPDQMLNSIGMDGFWRFYRYTGDASFITNVYPHVKNYLTLWTMQSNGLVAKRAGWDWDDWGTNIDNRVIQNCWYYWTCRAAEQMAALTGNNGDIAFFKGRADSIKANFDNVYWTGSAYQSTAVSPADERANAMAVVVGLASPDKYPAIKTAIQNSTQAGPYMEKYIMEALFLMGQPQAALDRMKSRYLPMVNSGKTTLYENFPTGGTMNHAWNVPNLLLSQYVGGIAPLTPGFATYQVLPQLGALTSVQVAVPSVKGMITAAILQTNGSHQIQLVSPADTLATVGLPRAGLPVSHVTANGSLIYTNGGFVGGVPGIGWGGMDTDYIKFIASPGTWIFAGVSSVTNVLASAGPDQSVTDLNDDASEPITLDGSGSATGAGVITTYVWKEGGTTIATGVTADVTLSVGVHLVTLTVTTSGGATNSDTLTVTVNPFVMPEQDGLIFGELTDSAPRKADGSSPSLLASTASDPTLYAGRSGTGGSVDRCMVFAFKLPSLGSRTNPFATAAFSFDLAGNDFAPTNCNLDLYGLTGRSSPAVLATDFYSETNVPDPTAGTARLQDNICSSGSAPGLYGTSAGGSSNLVNYMNAQYAGGANAGKFAFLRLSKDAPVGTSTRKYTVTSANGAATNYTLWPQIQYTVVTAPTAPPTLETAGWTNGVFSFTVAAESDSGCVVEASTNLATWQQVWSSDAPPPWHFADASSSNFGQRFYRVLINP